MKFTAVIWKDECFFCLCHMIILSNGNLSEKNKNKNVFLFDQSDHCLSNV